MDDWGFAVAPGGFGEEELDAVARAVGAAGAPVHARRTLLESSPEVAALAGDPRLLAVVRPLLGAGAAAVKATLFDKIPGKNWFVPWHQDLTIEVRERVEAPGYGPWSEKGGVVNVQPPVAVLEGIVAVRLHLDDCGADKGALRVLPGSHRGGRLAAAAIEEWAARAEPVLCTVPRGGLLLMRPLLLHASATAREPSHRRVIHLEYAAGPLPGGVRWRSRAFD